MKRQNTPSTGANKENPSPGLTLDSASVWRKRDGGNRQADEAAVSAASAPASSSSSTPAAGHWARYIDSRLKQFGCR
jgi:hypothetical protein